MNSSPINLISRKFMTCSDGQGGRSNQKSGAFIHAKVMLPREPAGKALVAGHAFVLNYALRQATLTRQAIDLLYWSNMLKSQQSNNKTITPNVSPDSPHDYPRDPDYYFSDGSAVFLVDGILFKVRRAGRHEDRLRDYAHPRKASGIVARASFFSSVFQTPCLTCTGPP
jgi:hypothetical protein